MIEAFIEHELMAKLDTLEQCFMISFIEGEGYVECNFCGRDLRESPLLQSSSKTKGGGVINSNGVQELGCLQCLAKVTDVSSFIPA